jgi:hypothetical protein
MRPVPLLIGLIVAAGATTATARCPGDFNLDENTTVDEIVAAVDSALNGCPAPVGCPIGFAEPTADDEACYFVGRYHPLCGDSNLEAYFVSDGQDVVISFFDPDIDFFAEVVDDGIAELFAWQEITDPQQDPVTIDGEVLLSDPPREALTVSPTEVPFAIDDCDFERYDGRFAEYVIFSPAIAKDGGGASAERKARGIASKARLRQLSLSGDLARLKAEKRSRQSGGGASAVRRMTTDGKPRLNRN